MSPPSPVADDGAPESEAAPPWRAEARVGTVVGRRYRLDRLIGRGGSGATFASHDLQLARAVAVKLMLPRDADRANDNVRFMQEARIASGLRHPHIVEIFDVGVDDQGLPFLVMELLDGHTLQHELRDLSTLTPREALAWLLPIMGAVAYAHDRGIVHRDLKPDNIFLARDASGRTVPQLLDFGVAKSSDGATLTRSGTVVGTPAFMSPEQALDEPLGPPTDVWSMGVILFRALSGHLPFEGDGLTSVLLKIVSTPAPTLAAHGPALPRVLTFAVDRALRRDQATRYATLREFARALVAAAFEAGIELPADPEPVGLPDYTQWRKSLEADPATVRTPKVSVPAPVLAPVATVDSKVEAKPARVVLRGPAVIVGILSLLGAAYALWPSSQPRATPSAPATSPTKLEAASEGTGAATSPQSGSPASSLPASTQSKAAVEGTESEPEKSQAADAKSQPDTARSLPPLKSPKVVSPPRPTRVKNPVGPTDKQRERGPADDTIELQNDWR